MSRLNLPDLEEEIQRYWKEQGIFQEVVQSRKSQNRNKKFYFLQGPPFTSGKTHLGHAWNHALKDFVIRYKTMQGYDVLRRAGWDMHGLPIEVKVEEEILRSKTKKDIEDFGIENFISECKKFALNSRDSMTKELQRLGVWLDWDDPYMTLDRSYMESVWFGIKKAYQKNLLYQDRQVIHWCTRCETAVTGYEAKDEYRDVEDFSVYVKAQLKDRQEKIVLWTTTPWTLPANVAIALHPGFTYVKVKLGEEVLILAKERLDILGEEPYEIIGEMTGSDMDGWEYLSLLDIPLQQGVSHKIVMAQGLVNLEEGTGCVHIAPGHGEEDFVLGKEQDLEVLSPVDQCGKLTAEPYQGIHVMEANQIIIEDLKSSGILLKVEKISHRYPHCWRCKSPLILRSTKQWFLKISRLKDELIKKNQEIEWIPESIGSGRFHNWLENARDWCISRQRYWNTPLPIWTCSCGRVEVVSSVKELAEKSTQERDWDNLDLHRPQIDEVKLKCAGCQKDMSRVPDVLDVWIDSGSSSWANLGYPNKKEGFELLFPADFITEGSDQTRGWFYSLLVMSFIAFEKIPYKRVLYHGFTLDSEGKKMSKSLGNVIPPGEIISKYGADVLRFYTLSAVPWEDLRFSIEEISSVEKTFHILWNSFQFAKRYMELDDFSFSSEYQPNYEVEDRWMLSRFNSLVDEVTEGMEKVYPHEVARKIQNFILEWSRWYIKLIRERVWMKKGNDSKIAAYCTLHQVLVGLSKLMAPLTPHISEHIYRTFTGKRSVHLADWPLAEEKYLDKELEEQMTTAQQIVENVKASRESARIKLRWPIPKVIISLRKGVAINQVEELILRASNARELEKRSIAVELLVKPNFATIGPKFKQDAGRIKKLLEESDAGEVKKELEEKGEYSPDKGISLKKEDLLFETKVPEGLVSQEFDQGVVWIKSELSPELYSEAMAREVIRRIQEMRKELQLNELEKIEVFINCSEKFKPFVENNREIIGHETRAEINLGERQGYGKDWVIEGEKVKVIVIK